MILRRRRALSRRILYLAAVCYGGMPVHEFRAIAGRRTWGEVLAEMDTYNARHVFEEHTGKGRNA